MQEMIRDFLFLATSVATGVFFGLLSWYMFLFALTQFLNAGRVGY